MFITRANKLNKLKPGNLVQYSKAWERAFSPKEWGIDFQPSRIALLVDNDDYECDNLCKILIGTKIIWIHRENLKDFNYEEKQSQT